MNKQDDLRAMEIFYIAKTEPALAEAFEIMKSEGLKYSEMLEIAVIKLVESKSKLEADIDKLIVTLNSTVKSYEDEEVIF